MRSAAVPTNAIAPPNPSKEKLSSNVLLLTESTLMPKPAKMITAYGRTQKIGDWVKESGIPYRIIWIRLQSDWPSERAVSEPVGHSKRNSKSVKLSKPRELRELKKLKQAKSPKSPQQLPLERHLNPQALEALKTWAHTDKKRNTQPFLIAYKIIYTEGPMTGGEVDLSAGKLDLFGADRFHNFCSILAFFGLVEQVGKRICAKTKQNCKLWDVTSKVPTSEISWCQYTKQRALKNPVAEPSKALTVTSKTPIATPLKMLPAPPNTIMSDGSWLKTAAREFRRLTKIMDRTGQHYSTACHTAIAFLEREAKRCEELMNVAGKEADSDDSAEIEGGNGPLVH